MEWYEREDRPLTKREIFENSIKSVEGIVPVEDRASVARLIYRRTYLPSTTSNQYKKVFEPTESHIRQRLKLFEELKLNRYLSSYKEYMSLTRAEQDELLAVASATLEEESDGVGRVLKDLNLEN